MARTLFFLEALALAALSLLLPIIASEVAGAFVIPFALSLLLPLACVLSVWPARAVRGALFLVFSARGGDTETREAALILESLGSFSRPVSVIGIILALAVAATRLPLSGDTRIWPWLGAYLSLYALVNATLWRTLAAVARRMPPAPVASVPVVAAPPAPDTAQAMASRYGLSPREVQAAVLIAGGMSYKETSADMGISIKTLKTHMGRVYEKTGAVSNVALSLLFRETMETGPDHTKVR